MLNTALLGNPDSVLKEIHLPTSSFASPPRLAIPIQRVLIPAVEVVSSKLQTESSGRPDFVV